MLPQRFTVGNVIEPAPLGLVGAMERSLPQCNSKAAIVRLFLVTHISRCALTVGGSRICKALILPQT
jgi:hypothetical protein